MKKLFKFFAIMVIMASCTATQTISRTTDTASTDDGKGNKTTHTSEQSKVTCKNCLITDPNKGSNTNRQTGVDPVLTNQRISNIITGCNDCGITRNRRAYINPQFPK